MNGIDFGKLKDLQAQMASQIQADDSLKIDEIRYVAGFDVSYIGNKCICSAVVLDFKTLKIVEQKHVVSKMAMNYVPGFLAFREGPPICEAYFDLETNPDVLLVDGHGIAHPMHCGLATFVGVELGKPCIGVAKTLLVGEHKGDDVVMDGEIVGRAVKTKEHANPLFVSIGNLINLDIASEIVKRCVVPPHKMPEPIHMAHRCADKLVAKQKEELIVKKEEIII